ncbi:MAG: ComEC/Rec2 family competence protein [Clostridia bacterium]|nr:ComEC/Rec2 family competence protein [Clostridia bacterium]
MHIFHKRPLGLILCVILGGFSVFTILSDTLRVLALSLAIALLGYIFISKKKFATSIKIAVIALILSFFASFVYFTFIFYPNEFYSEDVTVEAKVVNLEENSEYSRALDLKTVSINGKRCNYNIKLYLYGNDEIDVGDTIKFDTSISAMENGGSFNYKQYYTTRGFSATVTATSCEVTDSGSPPISYYITQFRKSICNRAARLSSESAGAMLGALLLGEREMLGGQVTLDFMRIGITHILSLSGMHVAMLMVGIDRLLYLFRVNKKWRVVLGMVACFLFMALTGFPLTVCRAGLMLIISSCVYLLTGCKDAITSLFLAAAVIILIYPYSAIDLGLWLSILATAGIILASEFMNEKYSEYVGFKKAARSIYASVIFSLFAIMSTYVIVALTFDTTSSLSVLSTMIFSPIIEIFVYLGIIVLLFGELIPIGKLLVLSERIIVKLAENFSEIPFAFASSSFIIVKAIFILLGAIFALFAVLKIENKKRFTVLMSVLFAITVILPVGLTESKKSDDSLIAFSGESDRIIVRSQGYALLFDASGYDVSEMYKACDALASEKIVDLDYYMVASYSGYLPDSLDVLLRNNAVSNVLLPMPRSYDEEEIAIQVFKTVNNYRTEVAFYEDRKLVNVGDVEILVPFRSYTEDALAVTFKHLDKIYSYLSSGIMEYVPTSEELLYVSDTLIFGNWGEEYTYGKTIDEFGKTLKNVYVFDESINFDTENIIWEKPKFYFSKEKIKAY